MSQFSESFRFTQPYPLLNIRPSHNRTASVPGTLRRRPFVGIDRRGSFLSRGAPNMKRVLVLVLALFVGMAAGAVAQIATGNINGTIVDQGGGVLPGATVSLVSTTIGGQPRTTITDASGRFRFLNLDAGTYKLSAELAGFAKLEREVIV